MDLGSNLLCLFDLYYLLRYLIMALSFVLLMFCSLVLSYLDCLLLFFCKRFLLESFCGFLLPKVKSKTINQQLIRIVF